MLILKKEVRQNAEYSAYLRPQEQCKRDLRLLSQDAGTCLYHQKRLELIGELNLLPPAAALRAYDLLCEQIKSLGHMPERCPRPRDLALRARGYRCLSVVRYLVLYTISGSDVLLRRILRRRPEHSGLLI